MNLATKILTVIALIVMVGCTESPMATSADIDQTDSSGGISSSDYPANSSGGISSDSRSSESRSSSSTGDDVDTTQYIEPDSSAIWAMEYYTGLIGNRIGTFADSADSVSCTYRARFELPWLTPDTLRSNINATRMHVVERYNETGAQSDYQKLLDVFALYDRVSMKHCIVQDGFMELELGHELTGPYTSYHNKVYNIKVRGVMVVDTLDAELLDRMVEYFSEPII